MSDLRISHGMIDHDADNRQDCIDCLDAEILWLRALKKAGGITKFIQKLTYPKLEKKPGLTPHK